VEKLGEGVERLGEGLGKLGHGVKGHVKDLDAQLLNIGGKVGRKESDCL